MTVAPLLLTCDFCLFGLHQLTHHGQDVLASLKSNEELLKDDLGAAAPVSSVVLLFLLLTNLSIIFLISHDFLLYFFKNILDLSPTC